MFRYWLKNRLLYTVILTLLIAGAIGYFFVAQNVKTESENQAKISVYEKSEMDCDIPAPTKEQLETISKLDFVNSVFGYYYTETDVKAGEKTVRTKILLCDNMDNIEITMYNSKRLIHSGDSTFSNPIYVDFDFSKKTGVSVGDEIEINSVKYLVAGLYETNTYNKAIMVPLTEDQKSIVEANMSSYSGAFIDVNDVQKAENYFRKYKPEGRLKAREAFASDQEYQIHYKAWSEANYFNEITFFSGKKEGIAVGKVVDVKTVIAVYAAGILLVNIVLFARKRERKYFKEKKSKKHIMSYYIVNALVEAGLAAAVILMIGRYAVDNCSNYVASDVATKNIYYVAVACSAVSIICLILNKIMLSVFANENK